MSRIEVRGAHASSSNSPALFFLVVIALGVVAAILAREKTLPWLRPFGGDVGGGLICASTYVAGWTIAVALSRRSMSRSGRVVLEEAHAFFERDGYSAVVFWEYCAGYLDGDSDYVELVLHEGAPRSPLLWPLTIPTLREEDRVAVLAALDARGLRRLS
ncbi:MAG: hypothetical protein ACAI25_03415 [Planctomycetota bacterium]